MKNKVLVLILLVVITIPQIASAAWWNPFSWRIFTRFFEHKTEEVQKVATTENVASSTDDMSEIEKLRAEVEELKNQKIESNNTTKVDTPTIKSVNAPAQIPVITIDYEEKYKKILSDYVLLRDQKISNEIDKLNEINTQDAVKLSYLNYLKTLKVSLNTDIGAFSKYLDIKPKPASIVDLYESKYNGYLSTYNTENKKYNAYLADLTELQKVKEASDIEQAILDKQEIVKDIKVKIAEMDQLRTQIDTLAGVSLINVLNTAKKLDGKDLFYTFQYDNGWSGTQSFNYPYSQSSCNTGCPQQIRFGLQAIVENYRAFLNVELAKNQ